MLFTYRIYKEIQFIEIKPTNEFYNQFKHIKKVDAPPSPIYGGYVVINNDTLIFEYKCSDHTMTNDLCYEMIQFCMNNIGEYIEFVYYDSRHRSIWKIKSWTFKFKITNKKLLLELL